MANNKCTNSICAKKKKRDLLSDPPIDITLVRFHKPHSSLLTRAGGGVGKTMTQSNKVFHNTCLAQMRAGVEEGVFGTNNFGQKSYIVFDNKLPAIPFRFRIRPGGTLRLWRSSGGNNNDNGRGRRSTHPDRLRYHSSQQTQKQSYAKPFCLYFVSQPNSSPLPCETLLTRYCGLVSLSQISRQTSHTPRPWRGPSRDSDLVSPKLPSKTDSCRSQNIRPLLTLSSQRGHIVTPYQTQSKSSKQLVVRNFCFMTFLSGNFSFRKFQFHNSALIICFHGKHTTFRHTFEDMCFRLKFSPFVRGSQQQHRTEGALIL